MISKIQEQIDVFAGDIRDANGVSTAMRGSDVVLHHAALIAVTYSSPSPDAYVATNVQGILHCGP